MFTDENAEPKKEFFCTACSQDLMEFESRPENALPDLDPDDFDALEREWPRLEERDRRKEEFMRERVKARGSKGGES